MKRHTLRILPRLAFTFVLGTAALAAPVFASQDAAEAGAQALPAAATLLDKFEAATNAKAVVDSTSYIHVKGKMTMAAMGLDGSMEVWEAKPDKSLMKMEMGAVGTMTMGYTDGVAYSTNPMMGSQVLDGLELLQRSLDADYGNLKNRSLYESMETVGKEEFAGKDCYKIKFVAKPLAGMDAESTLKGRTSYEFYDVETGMGAGSVMTQQSQTGEMEVTSIVNEYKKFGEATVASKTTQKMAMGEVVIEVLSIEYPDELDAAMFQLPKDIAAQVEKKKAAAAK